MEVAKETVLLEVRSNEITELVSITEICRLCANQNEKLIGIYSDEGENNELASKMNSYLPVKVDKTDDLPLQCCWQCASTVLAWHELVISSIEADRRLRSSQLVSEKQLQTSSDTNLAHIESRKVKTEKSTDCKEEFYEIKQEDRDSSSDEGSTDGKEETKEVEKKNKEYLESVDLTNNSCISCKLSFSTKTKLANHMLKTHQLKQIRIRRKKSSFNTVFTCSDCRKSFTRKYDLQRHITKVHPDSNTELSNRHKNFELLNKHKVSEDGMVYYKCDLCDVKLTKSSSFVDHYNIHLNKKLHCCHLCGKKFRTSSHVHRHINVVHYGMKKFACEYCENTFSTKSAKDEHVNTHTNNRPYMCALCGKSFKQSSSLYVHKMFHAQIYRFTCNVCGKKFKRGGELKKHQVVHTCKRDYDCEICKKSFRLAQDLKRHQKTHGSYSCNDCGMDFEQMKLFKIHKKGHEKK